VVTISGEGYIKRMSPRAYRTQARGGRGVKGMGTKDEDFVERLLLAMEAGEAAGGDQRGKQAAAILIQGPEPFARLSLRVDDHEDPLAELRRLADAAKRALNRLRRRCLPQCGPSPWHSRPRCYQHCL